MRMTEDILRAARAERAVQLSEGQKNNALEAMARSIEAHSNDILEANRLDVETSRGSISEVMTDRLTLTPERIYDMAHGVRAVAALPDPVGRVLETTKHENGLIIEKTSVPLGVIAIIYESRPNVTSDAAALCIKSGNVCILRCGKEAHRSSEAVAAAMREGLESTGISPDRIMLVEDVSRDSANELMRAEGTVDLLIPRGGAGLIRACTQNATVPCIQTGTGICHIYVDEYADIKKALKIIENAKASRPSVCNAAEVCLVHEKIAPEFLPKLSEALTDKRSKRGLCPIELRLDKRAGTIICGRQACSADFDTEFLDYVMAVGVVGSVVDAVRHISEHSTHHSDAIITENTQNAGLFTACVDSAAVYVNASTRFTDGGQFGLGCEMGISTQKLHARGPMGLSELTTYKYIIHGNGQIRE